MKLSEKLASAAWSILNHDNDPHDGQEHNTANWGNLVDAIEAVLKRSTKSKAKRISE